MAHFFLDFDYTLGVVGPDIDERVNAYIAGLIGVSVELVNRAFDLIPDGIGYSIEGHIRAIDSLTTGVTFDIKAVTAAVVKQLYIEFDNILFDDVLTFVEKLKKAGHTFSIVTFGGRDYQYVKLVVTGLIEEALTYRIIELDGGKPAAIRSIIDELTHQGVDVSKLVFIDDRDRELRRVSGAPGLEHVQCIRIARDGMSDAGVQASAETLPEDEFVTIRSMDDIFRISNVEI